MWRVWKGNRFHGEVFSTLFFFFLLQSLRYPMLIWETNPGEKQRVSCWTRKETLPPFCLASRWRSPRCWGFHPVSLESDRSWDLTGWRHPRTAWWWSPGRASWVDSRFPSHLCVLLDRVCWPWCSWSGFDSADQIAVLGWVSGWEWDHCCSPEFVVKERNTAFFLFLWLGTGLETQAQSRFALEMKIQAFPNHCHSKKH